MSTCHPSLLVEAAVSRKTSKYANLPATHIFQPLAFETHSTTHSSATDFLNAVGGRSTTVTGDPSDTTFWQCVSVVLQRFNTILISETFVQPDDAPDL